MARINILDNNAVQNYENMGTVTGKSKLLEWFAMRPVMLQQFRLFYDGLLARRLQDTKPIGVLPKASEKTVFWAEASSEVAQMLANGTTKLRPQDWKSGSELWVVEAVAPFGGADVMVADLKQRVFPTRELRFVVLGSSGKGVRVV